MTNMPTRREAASTSRHGSTAACSRETSLPSAAPNPPGSRKSRCMSLITSADLSKSTERGSGSACNFTLGITISCVCNHHHVQDRGQPTLHLGSQQDHDLLPNY